MPRKGLVTIFTGDGKGKTTAAIGTAVRAAGYGLRVYIVFFLKGKMFSQGEALSLERFPNIKTVSFGANSWIKKGAVNAQARTQAAKALKAASKAMDSGDYDLVIMDEVNGAVDFGLIPLEDVIEVVTARPESVDLLLTGRHADARIIQMADVVTEMVNVKHAFERGVKAREGIDF
ncbi:MAG: cob(I)alamin adenolsyltransferase [Dehalococcoidia bacterium]|nr:MAG: cob(I)alamin adenolsyltransferase [Dehalococcoidia bacterium]